MVELAMMYDEEEQDQETQTKNSQKSPTDTKSFLEKPMESNSGSTGSNSDSCGSCPKRRPRRKVCKRRKPKTCMRRKPRVCKRKKKKTCITRCRYTDVDRFARGCMRRPVVRKHYINLPRWVVTDLQKLARRMRHEEGDVEDTGSGSHKSICMYCLK